MDPEKQLALFYDHYERYSAVFNISDNTKAFFSLNYNFLATDLKVKSDGIQKKYDKHTLNVMFPTDSELFKIVRGIEEFIERKVLDESVYSGYTFKSAIFKHEKSGNSFMNVQIPYRNKKMECIFIDNTSGRHIMAFDIKEKSNVNIQLRCACIWIYHETKQFGITWQGKHVYLLK